MKTFERRQSLIELLCIRRYEKIENLAFEFSVSERTIRNDLQELSLLYPLYTRTGTYGGVYVADGYYLGRQYLKTEEKQLLEELSFSVGDDQRKILASILKRFSRPNKVK